MKENSCDRYVRQLKFSNQEVRSLSCGNIQGIRFELEVTVFMNLNESRIRLVTDVEARTDVDPLVRQTSPCSHER